MFQRSFSKIEDDRNMENHGNKRKKNHWSPLFDLLRDFCGYTSWGGLGRVVGTKFVVFKVLWVLIFLAALGISVYQLIPLFYKYRSRPINTRISLRHNATLEFPSVVFCNFNMIRKSHIHKLPESIKEVLSEYIGG
ncbi:acid-sensing ion channel 5-like [Exaiptasia diaphana]|uniref:Uncharacterized protein n=1 Tax=Exaiptasia diaphana TaxID=2652724 RepID=A0A913YRH4_EXADI|nr:acid-sensing ion channel 5-like [Exaiptasia diaphana]